MGKNAHNEETAAEACDDGSNTVASEGAKLGRAHARPLPTDTPQPRFPYAGAWTKGLANVLSGSCSGRKGRTSTVFITELTSV